MPTFINTNMNSMNVQMALNSSQAQQTTAMQRLATGLRINSAADNAAGYAIATRMSAQIAGDTQAAANANDAISLTQTAGGDLTQITNNLQTMRNLAVQASNATNSASDRAALNNQLQALSSEIDRVAQNSSFNGVNLLDGSFTAQNFQIGANAGASNQIQITSIASARTSQLGAAGGTNYAATASGVTTVSALAAGSLTLNGVSVGASVVGVAGGENAASAMSIANAINATTGTSGVTATASATIASGLSATTFTAIAANTFSINGINVGAVAAGGAAVGQGANVAAAINLVSAQSGVTATANATTGAVTLTAADGRNINITANTNNGGVPAQITSTNLTAATGFASTLSDTAVGAAATTVGALTISVNGTSVVGATGTTAVATAQNFVAAFNTLATAATFGAGISGITASSDSNGVITLTSNGSVASIGISTAAGGFTLGTTYTSQHGSVNLSSSNVNGLVISGGVSNGTAGVDGLNRTTTAAITSASNMTTLSSVNISTAAGAAAALATIDGALAMVTATQAALGAVQNRFTSVVTSLQTTSSNLTAAQSRIQSTDYAAETANLSRTQILQQAGNAMLAQANQQPNQVMTLLR